MFSITIESGEESDVIKEMQLETRKRKLPLDRRTVTTWKHFSELEKQQNSTVTIDIKHVGGSAEIACILELANGILDLVEPVQTMKAADLYIIYHLRDRDYSNI